MYAALRFYYLLFALFGCLLPYRHCLGVGSLRTIKDRDSGALFYIQIHLFHKYGDRFIATLNEWHAWDLFTGDRDLKLRIVHVYIIRYVCLRDDIE